MPTTTGDHPLTYPAEGATNWYSTWESFAQAISNHLDSLVNVQIDIIEDSNDNELLSFSAVASAANFITITNATASAGPILAAAGSATNVDLNLNPKGSGRLNLDAVKWPAADGSANQVLITDGSGSASWSGLVGSLGGNIDVNGNEIISSSSGDIVIHSDNDVNIRLGDNLGADDLNIQDAGGTTRANIDSDGNASFRDVTSSNTITATATVAAANLDIGSSTVISSILDQDDMSSDSATALATQQSIKAYVDDSVASRLALISQTTATSVATVDISLSASYDVHMLVAHGVRPQTDDVEFYVRMSSDNGATYKIGANDYQWVLNSVYQDGSNVNQTHDDGDNTFTAMRMARTSAVAPGNNSTVGESIGFVMYIYSARSSTHRTQITADIVYSSSETGSNIARSNFAGFMNTLATEEAIRFLTSSGNIDTGTFVLYGLQES